MGKKAVIDGLERGIANMKQGGSRQLIIEPKAAYGDSRLLFTFKLLNIQ